MLLRQQPIQAANSRPLRKAAPLPMEATIDSALVEEPIIDDEGSACILSGGTRSDPNISDRTFNHDYYFELPG
jgi:hypothetical protein